VRGVEGPGGDFDGGEVEGFLAGCGGRGLL
jgi:hypothetical protein